MVRASTHEFQKPLCAVQSEQMSVAVRLRSRLVSQLSIDWEPRKERMMALLVWSTATKPVTSVRVSVLGVVSLCGWK